MSIVISELKQTLGHWRIWWLLATQDIQLRYKRSTLGPFWITISMAVTIYSIGFLYGHLFKIETDTYLPFLASGLIGWGFISTLLNESPHVFVEAEAYIRNIKLPYPVFMIRIILRNMVVFLHNLIAFLPIYLVTPLKPGFYLLLLIPNLLLIVINAVFWGTLIALLGARFRDLAQIISSVLQLVFFVTPVMWMPKLIPEHYHWIIQFNPFYHFLDLVRAPLLNQSVSSLSVMVVSLISLVGLLLLTVVFAKCRTRLVYWL